MKNPLPKLDTLNLKQRLIVSLLIIAFFVILICRINPSPDTHSQSHAHARTPAHPVVTYPIPQQPGIWPPEAPGWNQGDLPGRGQTKVTAWMFCQNNIFDTRSPLVDIDYLALYAVVNGSPVLVTVDDYGTGKGQQANVSGDWTPRANYTDPALETVGMLVYSWAPTYVTLNSATNLKYGLQLWTSSPGKIPTGTTKLYAKVRYQIHGSGLICFGFDFYNSSNQWVANAGYSGFQTYLPSNATPSWQEVTFPLGS